MVLVIRGPGCLAGTLNTGPGHIFTELGSQPPLERCQRGEAGPVQSWCGNCCWEPEVACSYQGGITDISPTQAAGSDRNRGRPLAGSERALAARRVSLPSQAPWGLMGNLLGELPCVSPYGWVLQSRQESWVRGESSLLPLTFI